jgi:hypothetical protein
VKEAFTLESSFTFTYEFVFTLDISGFHTINICNDAAAETERQVSDSVTTKFTPEFSDSKFQIITEIAGFR